MAKLSLYGENENQKKTTRSVLAHVLDQTLRMLHPYMPFITEEIWQQLPHKGDSITIAAWPQVNPNYHDEQASEQMENIMAIIRAVRNIRAEVNTPMSKQVSMYVKTIDQSLATNLEKHRLYLERFCNTSELVITPTVEAPEQSMTAVITGAEIFLPLEGLIDIEKEIARLEKELQKWKDEVALVQKKLSNQGFVDKAPEKVVEAERKKEVEYLEKRTMVEERLNELKQQ